MNSFTPISVVLPGAGQFPGARVTRIKKLSFNDSGDGEPSGTSTHTHKHTLKERERETHATLTLSMH